MDDGARLTLDDVKAAAMVGRLGEVARQLVFEGQWGAVDGLIQHATGREIAVDVFVETARTLLDTLTNLSDTQQQANADEILGVRQHLARALARRAGAAPLTESERQAANLSGILNAALGDLRLAAELFERAGEDPRAAEAYGALGDLENMERCLERDEDRRSHRRAISEGVRQAELLLAIGARWSALQVIARLPTKDADAESAGLRVRAREIERRLCRGRAVSLRLPDGRLARLCAAPATIGRDTAVEVVLRDPTVSRRHASISASGSTFVIADAGSRTGTRIAGVPIAGSLRLGAEGELSLGDHARLRFRQLSATLLTLVGLGGLDRALVAYVGLGDWVELEALTAEATGLAIAFEGPVVQLRRPTANVVRIGGRLVGPATDLLHGDVIELASGARLEVV